jgi:hypothetical protein
MPTASRTTDGDQAQRCILCGASGNPPSIEHIVPAGLGRHVNLCLPEGTVCEPCNNHFGRQTDEAMVHLFEVRLIRALHRVPDREGRVLTKIQLGNGVMHFPPDGGVEIEVHGEGHIEKRSEKNLVINVIDKRAKSGDQWRRATRSLMKSGLSLLCYSGGVGSAFIPDSTFHPDWGPLRAAIHGEPHHGYLLIGSFDIFAAPNFAISRSAIYRASTSQPVCVSGAWT